jgi:hypothetical protein
MGGVPYNQAGGLYNSLLQQGFTGNDIRNALTTQGRPVSDSDYGFLVQNAAMTSPTGRPMAGSDQFFQPVYQPQYQNYNMGNFMGVSQYGQQPSYGGFGGGYGGGYGGGFMPQMQTPFNPYMNQYQSPFSYQQPMPQRTSSGPSQAIVGRSSQMRGTPNVMRRAEGGIASLMDDVE